jgi:hypothetical protein
MTKAALFPPFWFRVFVPRGAPIYQFGIFKSLIVFLHSPILGTSVYRTVFISRYVNSIDHFNTMSFFVQSFIDFIRQPPFHMESLPLLGKLV